MVAMNDRAQSEPELPLEADDDFTVAQDTEFDEAEPVEVDEERPVDDGKADEVTGLDAERRVDLTEEPGSSAGSTD